MIAAPLNVRSADEAITDPFICHSETSPLVSRQRISVRWSPLKSAMPAMLHDASGRTRTPLKVRSAEDAIALPFMLQSISSPALLRHSMSEWPLSLKSLLAFAVVTLTV